MGIISIKMQNQINTNLINESKDKEELLVYSGMEDEKYEKVCKQLFNQTDYNNDGVLELEEFKKFTIKCAEAGGAPREDIDEMNSAGSESMWQMMFRQFDGNNDGHVTWEETWQFLKENRP